MLNWLFKSKPVNNKFSGLSIGQRFQKIGWDENTYVKVDNFQYQTTNIDRCDNWFMVREDFEVLIEKDLVE